MTQILVKGQGYCPWCHKPVRTLDQVRMTVDGPKHHLALCNADRYLVMEADPAETGDDRLVVYEESTGAFVFGRRATKEERRWYQEKHKSGQDNDVGDVRFLIGYRPHLPCPRWDGTSFRGWVEPQKEPANIKAEPVPDEVAYEEHQILLGL
jgi:hypothetical protein